METLILAMVVMLVEQLRANGIAHWEIQPQRVFVKIFVVMDLCYPQQQVIEMMRIPVTVMAEVQLVELSQTGLVLWEI